MQSAIDATERFFLYPALRVTAHSLAAHFGGLPASRETPLRNPHHEPRVDRATREAAVSSSVLIPIVDRVEGLSLLLTRRHEAISYPGHICFPGGRADPGDASPEATALRETEEEIGLPRSEVRVLGRLGAYVTHSGHRITPVVALLEPPGRLRPAAGEVEEILEIPLAAALDARCYRLREPQTGGPRAYFILEHGDAIVTGPTVSVLIGLYEALLETHG